MPDAPGESAFEDTHRKPRRAKKLQAVLRRERRTRHVWQDHAGCTTCLRSLRNKSRARAKKSLSHLARQGALHYRRQRCRRPQSSRRHPQKKDGMLPVLEGSVRGIPDRWPCSEPLGQERGPGHSGRVLCPQRGSCHGPGRGSRPCEKGGRASLPGSHSGCAPGHPAGLPVAGRIPQRIFQCCLLVMVLLGAFSLLARAFLQS